MYLLGIIFQLIYISTVKSETQQANDNENLKTIQQQDQQNNFFKFVEELSKSIDFNVNPCDDFYAYACPKQNNRTEGSMAYTSTAGTNFTAADIIEKFFHNEDPEYLSDSQLKMKEFYGSCKAQRNLEQLKNTSLYENSGGWPAIDRNNTTIFNDWIDIIAEFDSIIGMNLFFYQTVYVQDNKRVVRISPNFNYKYSIQKYKDLSMKLLMEYGVSRNRAIKMTYILGKFERDRRTENRQTNGSSIDVVDITYNDFKNRMNASINWDNYFRKVLGKPLKPTDVVVLVNPNSLDRIFALLSRTDKTLLRNFNWIEYLLGKSSTECVELLKLYFQPVVYSIVERPQINKMEILQMLTKLGRAFDNNLVKSDWIDEISEANSKLYISKMKDLLLNGESQIDTEYETLRIDKINFYQNLQNMQKFLVTRSVFKTSLPLLYKHFKTSFHFADLPLALSFGTVGESFANDIIRGEKSSNRWSWRSLDSDNSLEHFKRRILRHQNSTEGGNSSSSTTLDAHIDKLILKLLSQSLSFAALKDWLDSNQNFRLQINTILKDSNNLSIEKLFFILSSMEVCRQNEIDHRELISVPLCEFTKTFKCPKGSGMRPRSFCMKFNKK